MWRVPACPVNPFPPHPAAACAGNSPARLVAGGSRAAPPPVRVAAARPTAHYEPRSALAAPLRLEHSGHRRLSHPRWAPAALRALGPTLAARRAARRAARQGGCARRPERSATTCGCNAGGRAKRTPRNRTGHTRLQRRRQSAAPRGNAARRDAAGVTLCHAPPGTGLPAGVLHGVLRAVTLPRAARFQAS